MVLTPYVIMLQQRSSATQSASRTVCVQWFTVTTAPYQAHLYPQPARWLQGSTCAMIESILRASGYSTGLFTSPHLCDVRERIRING